MGRASTLLLPLMAILLLLSCRQADRVEERPCKEVSISYLKAMCHGDRARVTEECYIRGVVVANDWMGEYYKSIVVVDSSGGVEVAIESESISTWLPINSEVEIFCGGKSLARVGGKVSLGATPTQDFLLDNIDEDEARRIIRVVGADASCIPTTKRIAEIVPADISNVVIIRGVHILAEEAGLAWCDVVDGEPQTTIRHLVDEEGNTLGVRTLATCTYATEKIPSTTFSVVGVVDTANGEYVLRIINNKIF